ncbi:MAG: YidC/Oxa1 family membrane protein insertase [Gemmatimonadaceae bacterium]|nr:YidC/Oxa1 family membrane protein insertase [Gemmatimonadaceae bacterium]
MWDSFVELLRLTIFSVAHVCGGSLGTAVVLVSAGLRLALLPLTLRMARQARAQQARMSQLTPQLDRLKRRFADDPAALMRATRALYADNGVRLLSPSAVINMMVQLPVVGGLFAAVRGGLGSRVRFLWIVDLAQPNRWLLALVTVLSTAALATMPAAPGQSRAPSIAWLLSIGMTMAFLWSASSAIALSMGASSMVTVLQNWLVSRDARRSGIVVR